LHKKVFERELFSMLLGVFLFGSVFEKSKLHIFFCDLMSKMTQRLKVIDSHAN
jgi:hypothetical protein|tara:strand:- start:1987 stop:2145 length:159 start_codon:yes stop_codon:yes gene_type:complete